jgi:hypothetical protein
MKSVKYIQIIGCFSVIHVQTRGTILYWITRSYAVEHLVEALRYKPEGRGFDSQCCNSKFSLT